METNNLPEETVSQNDHERMRRMVREYEAQLAQAKEFTVHICHEVNNPLTGVLGQTQLLLREDLSEKARQRVEVIENLAMRIRDTIVELRQYPMGALELDGTSDK